MSWEESYKRKLVSLEEAVSTIKSGDRISASPASSAPVDLVNALAKRYKELENVTIFAGLTMHPFEYLKPETSGETFLPHQFNDSEAATSLFWP